MDLVQQCGVFVMDHFGQVPTIVKDHVYIPGTAVLENGLLNAPQKFLFCFTFPGEHRNTRCGHCCSGMILSRKNITG